MSTITCPKMEVSPSSPVEGDSKSPDDDVLKILEDLETYADMKEDFLGDGGKKVSRRKRNRGGMRHKMKGICPNCNLRRWKKCQCHKGPGVPEVMPVIQPIYHPPPEIIHPVQPIYHPEIIHTVPPIYHPEIVHTIQPIYHRPPEIVPTVFLPYMYLFQKLRRPDYTLPRSNLQVLKGKQNKPVKNKKNNQGVKVNTSGVESAEGVKKKKNRRGKKNKQKNKDNKGVKVENVSVKTEVES